MDEEIAVEKLHLPKNGLYLFANTQLNSYIVDASLAFAWGSGNELAFFQDENVSIKTKVVPIKKRQLVEFYNWELIDKADFQVHHN